MIDQRPVNRQHGPIRPTILERWFRRAELFRHGFESTYPKSNRHRPASPMMTLASQALTNLQQQCLPVCGATAQSKGFLPAKTALAQLTVKPIAGSISNIVDETAIYACHWSRRQWKQKKQPPLPDQSFDRLHRDQRPTSFSKSIPTRLKASRSPALELVAGQFVQP